MFSSDFLSNKTITGSLIPKGYHLIMGTLVNQDLTYTYFKNWAGKWQVYREIKYSKPTDTLASRPDFFCNNAVFQGIADFTLLDRYVYSYLEQGKIKIFRSGTFFTANASKRYIYIYKSGAISVFFYSSQIHKRKLFHDIVFINPKQAKGIHYCKSDIYKIYYNFVKKTQFEVKYDILGPDKNYSINTNFLKL